ncbi:Signal transduction histidine kinase, nitrate /nitrite-specific [Paenibacillus macerans]|uniref:Histidine kinase-, DNA gyrase B-, and HSP90-like ATPase family protein n=2 Tax=Paenibacillus TaxID=44249 RepID=A0A090ZNE7_PAEMA|nr:histidine kinase-, DNA gyrase B-, and HSP90-like ATPase family protein [Paenibacillus macerans]SUA84425.1 Signal transduction histidine kinase, nitrate /nitrite-specific [Paenibacillus macerans]
MILLLHLFDYLKGIDEIIFPDNVALTYLERVGFFSNVTSYIRLNQEILDLNEKVVRNNNNTSMLEITKISNMNDIVQVLNKVNNQTGIILEKELYYNFDDTIDFLTILSELLNNITRHSKSYGYVCAQVYKYPNSNRKFASVCISDNGIGIKQSINESKYIGATNCSDRSALRIAIIDEVTSKKNGGCGYKGIKEKLKKFGGSLYVRSGSAEILISGKSKPKITDRRSSFYGTQIELILPQR